VSGLLTLHEVYSFQQRVHLKLIMATGLRRTFCILNKLNVAVRYSVTIWLWFMQYQWDEHDMVYEDTEKYNYV
jgi:hypothetical protein